MPNRSPAPIDRSRRRGRLATITLALSLVVTACTGASAGDEPADTLTLDWATYNPLSLVIRDQGWLEDELVDEGVSVEWIQSAGSNRANEGLRSGTLDVGSTAGSAALLARANGAPIHTIALYSQPEWAALVVPADSTITSLEELPGANIAATLGTDPYFFLVQALASVGLDVGDVEVNNLQHADGRTALEQGSVEVWAGLDPIMAAGEVDSGLELLHRDIDLNTWGFLNATERFLERSPDLAQLVVDTYERARVWAADNPDQTAALLAEEAGIDLEVARAVLLDRTNLDIDPVPGPDQRAVLETVGPLLVGTGDVANQQAIDTALEELFAPRFAEQADPSGTLRR